MKKGLLNYLMIIGLLLFSHLAEASCNGSCSGNCYDCCDDIPFDLKPILGIDFKGTHMSGRHDWNKIFPRYYAGASLYVANRFHENFGIELGFDVATKKGTTVNFPNNTTFFRLPTNAVQITSQVRIGGAHLDLSYYLPMMPGCGCFDLIGTYGIGVIKPKLAVNTSIAEDDIQKALRSLKSRAAVVWRAGLGTQAMLSNTLGFRILLRGEGTALIRLIGNSNFDIIKRQGVPERAFKDSISINIGLFSTF